MKRVTGRLEQSNIFSYDMRHPVLLPGQSLISKLILIDLHETLGHPGYNRVIGESRNKYWIINGIKLAKNIGYHCVDCRRWRRKQLDQLMADLPNFRIQRECAPFENIAVDYFGPFYIKFGRRQRIKAYGVVYTCLTTRAVYLDLATSLNTHNFLLTLKRFISLYGKPKRIHSDNGSNFRGASREIAVMIKRWKENAPDHEQ